jgi:predicted O-methyltransferase YrrM
LLRKFFLFVKIIFIIFRYLSFGYRRYAQILILILFNQPKKILEVGVYSGKRSKEMIEASLIFNNNIFYFGFDLFDKFKSKILKTEFSKKPISKEVIRIKLEKLCKVKLFEGYSHKTLPDFLKENKTIDFIFIDGGHSIKTIKNDWDNVKKMINRNSIVIFDDYYSDKKFSEKFGCNKIIKNLDPLYKFKILPVKDKIILNKKAIFVQLVCVRRVN